MISVKQSYASFLIEEVVGFNVNIALRYVTWSNIDSGGLHQL